MCSVAGARFSCTACRYAGINPDTYYEARKRDLAFAEKMDRAQDYPLIVAKKRVLTAIRDPKSDDSPALKFLERRQRDRYSPKIIQEHEGEVAFTYDQIENGQKATTPDQARKMAESTDELGNDE